LNYYHYVIRPALIYSAEAIGMVIGLGRRPAVLALRDGHGQNLLASTRLASGYSRDWPNRTARLSHANILDKASLICLIRRIFGWIKTKNFDLLNRRLFWDRNHQGSRPPRRESQWAFCRVWFALMGKWICPTRTWFQIFQNLLLWLILLQMSILQPSLVKSEVLTNL